MQAIEQMKLKRGRITADIFQDEDVEYDFDTLGKITYRKSSRYTLGTQPVDQEQFDEIKTGIENGTLVGMPVYAYVHGGATISTKPFTCPWDSGMSGFVYCTREAALREFGTDKDRLADAFSGALTNECEEKALACLKAEVEQFAMYLRGEVYGVVLKDKKGELLESCWGLYGLDYARQEARSMAKGIKL